MPTLFTSFMFFFLSKFAVNSVKLCDCLLNDKLKQFHINIDFFYLELCCVNKNFTIYKGDHLRIRDISAQYHIHVFVHLVL